MQNGQNKFMRTILKEGKKQEMIKFSCPNCGEEWETDGWYKNDEDKVLSSCNTCGRIGIEQK